MNREKLRNRLRKIKESMRATEEGNFISRFNKWLANGLADVLCTMLMFYGITILVTSILFFQMPQTPLEWVQFVVQTFFQGVALPILGFVGKISGQRTEKLLKETHAASMLELSQNKQEMKKMNELLLCVQEIRECVKPGMKYRE